MGIPLSLALVDQKLRVAGSREEGIALIEESFPKILRNLFCMACVIVDQGDDFCR